ncbi:GntR family transcriptional regulator [Paraflavitalea sp. CAU 1676]|uniref:FadR/GntR family transcriptional regulator n=1 Tax=Paraflavitalea sp. CAU 1676 TaxID=3032598 RepID=UPI0023DBD464|nr:GntR family transcriptional regulator [Paraflavitalea sp. CAU 1676]MDF2191700.1 GntR family transcriptional regulator [Paraflavitalea sp. CAU 1676]
MKTDQELYKLKPIASVTMADQVESQLRDYIIKRSIRPGDSIPKEMEIAEALGVSRNVVREALSRLRMLGMIESKKKRGMILTQPDVMKGLERILHPTILDINVRKELFELRLVLEVGLGDLLFKRKTAEHLQQLDAIVEREHRATTSIERIRCEVEFHSTLYEMAGNETLKRFQTILMPVFEYVVEYESKLEHTSVGTVTHADLVKILHGNKPDDFPNAMRQHLLPHLEHL